MLNKVHTCPIIKQNISHITASKNKTLGLENSPVFYKISKPVLWYDTYCDFCLPKHPSKEQFNILENTIDCCENRKHIVCKDTSLGLDILGFKRTLTFPVLWRMVVLVLQTLSLLTMSLVTSTSASTKLLCFKVMSSSRSVLMVERFLAIILALMAAIFSTDMASDSDLKREDARFDHLKSSLLWRARLWVSE